MVEHVLVLRKTILERSYFSSQLRSTATNVASVRRLERSAAHFRVGIAHLPKEIFSLFYETLDSVKRTGRHCQPAQADFEPSTMEIGAMVRHVCRCDTNVIRRL